MDKNILIRSERRTSETGDREASFCRQSRAARYFVRYRYLQKLVITILPFFPLTRTRWCLRSGLSSECFVHCVCCCFLVPSASKHSLFGSCRAAAAPPPLGVEPLQEKVLSFCMQTVKMTSMERNSIKLWKQLAQLAVERSARSIKRSLMAWELSKYVSYEAFLSFFLSFCSLTSI